MMNFTTFRATCLFQSIVTMGDKNGFLPFPKGFSTAAIHAGQNPEQWNFLSVVPPTVMSTTFKQHSPGNPEVVFVLLNFITSIVFSFVFIEI